MGQTALHEAARYGHEHVVAHLLINSKVDILNHVDNEGSTALHYAVQCG